ncbi:hypothetical protein CNR22_24130 [Sphingobacteriaceae bacterium]|nr:hypothetical protein CNR22_24130 [Sphingobacteriaceae bacterium]
MRFLFFVLVWIECHAQQTFIEVDSLSHFPNKTYESLGNYSCLLLGEMHGTAEAPLIVKSLADIFSKHQQVIIALEIPDENQQEINRYLKNGDETILQKVKFFTDTRDGRSSEAMARLIKSVYKKENIQLVCFDVSDYYSSNTYRDSLMAQNILRIKKQNPEAVLISLSGNIHSNTKKGFREGYQTMGYYLKKELGLTVISLNILYQEGTAYNCVEGICKERKMEPDNSQFKNFLRKTAFILIDPAFEASGIHGIIYLKEVTASLPYIQF